MKIGWLSASPKLSMDKEMNKVPMPTPLREYYETHDVWNKGKPLPEWLKQKISLARRGLINQPQPCACGCGQLTKRGNKFIHGHNLRVKNPVDDPEIRRKISKTLEGVHTSPETEFKEGNVPWWIERSLSHPIDLPEVREKVSKTWFGNLEGPQTCEICGEEFPNVFSLGGHVSGFHKGIWNKGIGDPDPYGYEFTEQLKEKVRRLYGRVCSYCGKIEEENGEKLSIHHIDGEKKNNGIRNLIPLCRLCHSKITVEKLKEVYERRT